MKISFSFSKARLLSAVLLAAAAVAVCLVCGGTVKFAAVIAAAFLAAGLLHLRAEGRRAWVLLPPLLAVSALFCVLLAQEADGIRDPLTAENYLLGTLCVLFPELLLYALQLLFSRRGPGLPICLSSGAGLPLPSYNRALEDIRQTIPALNSFGYYSLSRGRFQTLAEAEGAEKAALTKYELLEYNAIFDRRGRSQVFFPAPAVP